MILGCQADPGRKLPPRSEELGLRGLHGQQHGTDRADAGDLGETPAAFIGPMPGHELGLDVDDLRLQVRIFPRLNGEELASQEGQALIGLQAREQRNQVGCSLGRSQAELGGIAADGVGQLRAIADQPIAYPDHH